MNVRITVVSAEKLIEMLDGVNPDMKFRPSDEIINSLTEESNPVLIRYKMKQ